MLTGTESSLGTGSSSSSYPGYYEDEIEGGVFGIFPGKKEKPKQIKVNPEEVREKVIDNIWSWYSGRHPIGADFNLYKETVEDIINSIDLDKNHNILGATREVSSLFLNMFNSIERTNENIFSSEIFDRIYFEEHEYDEFTLKTKKKERFDNSAMAFQEYLSRITRLSLALENYSVNNDELGGPEKAAVKTLSSLASFIFICIGFLYFTFLIPTVGGEAQIGEASRKAMVFYIKPYIMDIKFEDINTGVIKTKMFNILKLLVEFFVERKLRRLSNKSMCNTLSGYMYEMSDVNYTARASPLSPFLQLAALTETRCKELNQ